MFAKNNEFLLCSAPEKALSKWDVVYEIVAVISSAVVMLIDFLPILTRMPVIFFFNLNLGRRRDYFSGPL